MPDIGNESGVQHDHGWLKRSIVRVRNRISNKINTKIVNMIKLGGTGEGRGCCPLPDVLPPSATCSLHFNCFPMHNCAKDIIARNSQVIGILMYTWRFPQNFRVHTLFVENRQIQISGQPDV